MRSDAGDAQTLAEMLYRCSLDGEMQKNGVARSLYGAYLQLVMSLVRKREDGMISSLHNDLMNNLWNARFDLSEEIKEIGYTEDYVRRLFRDRYGKTPLQFLLSERIEYAKKAARYIRSPNVDKGNTRNVRFFRSAVFFAHV